MAITWQDLAEIIAKMPKERQKDHVAVYYRDMDEVFQVQNVQESGLFDPDGDVVDVLDSGHFFLEIT